MSCINDIDEFICSKILVKNEELSIAKLNYSYKLGEVVNLIDFDFDPE